MWRRIHVMTAKMIKIPDRRSKEIKSVLFQFCLWFTQTLDLKTVLQCNKII